MTTRSIALLALAAVIAGAASAQAQATAIAPGQVVEDALGEHDPALNERGRARTYAFQARAGDRLVAVMRSTAFDAYLTLGRRAAGTTEYLEEDDDGGGGETSTDARIRFTVPADGEYLLLAQSLAPEGMGAYTLSLQHQPVPTTGEPRRIAPGGTVQGALAETDLVDDEDDAFYDSYLLDGVAGQRVMIEMRSTELDSFVGVGREVDGRFELIAADDDGGDDLDSRLRYTPDRTGPIVVRARSVGGETGRYTLSVTALGAQRRTSTPRPIHAGERLPGALDHDDALLGDGSYFDYWMYRGRPGERLRIDLASDDFDTFLAVGTLQGEQFHEIASNDDGPNGTDSQIEVVVPAGGLLAIRANSLSGGVTGEYHLGVLRLDR